MFLRCEQGKARTPNSCIFSDATLWTFPTFMAKLMKSSLHAAGMSRKFYMINTIRYLPTKGDGYYHHYQFIINYTKTLQPLLTQWQSWELLQYNVLYFLTSLITKYRALHSSTIGMSLHHHLRTFLVKQSWNIVTVDTWCVAVPLTPTASFVIKITLQ
jgi:hypothetical protein